jgi:hypothetical protein
MKTTIQLLSFAMVLTTVARGADYQQLPNHGGGLQSDGSLLVVADDFVLTNTTEISTFTWWGGYDNTPTATDSFVIGLHADSACQPGSLQPGFAVGSISKAPTGAFVNSGIYPEYIYTATLTTPFQAQGGFRYWLSIANSMPAGETWQWELSGSSPNFGVQRFLGGSWQPHSIVVGTSFEIPGLPVPEPSALVLLSTGWLFIRLLQKRRVQ